MRTHGLLIIVGTLLGMLTMGCESEVLTPGGGMQDGRFVDEKDLPMPDVNLQRLINDAADGGVIEVPLARYRLAKTLTIVRRANLHIAFAPGTQLRVEDTDGAVIAIEDCQGLKISGVRARHVDPLPQYECHGAVVFIRNSTDVHIDNCELNGCGAVGVSAKESTLKVTNCHIHNNTFTAFYFDSSEATVIGNIIEHNANTLQSYRSGNTLWSDNIVRDNGGYWSKPRKPGLKPESQPDLRPLTEK